MPAGRPTLLTPELQQEIIGIILGGNYIATAAGVAGVDYGTIKRWRRRGRKEIKRLLENPHTTVLDSEAPFVEFCTAIKRALHAAEAREVQSIVRAGQGTTPTRTVTTRTLPDGTVETTETFTEGRAPQWQASAWRLERMFKSRWGRTVQTEISGPGGKELIGIDTLRSLFGAADDGPEDSAPDDE